MTPEELSDLKQKLDILIALTVCQLEQRTDPGEVIAVLSRFAIQPSRDRCDPRNDAKCRKDCPTSSRATYGRSPNKQRRNER